MPGEPLGSTMGALDAATGELVISTSPTKASCDPIALLRRPDWRYGPKPGCERLPVVLVLDTGPVHTSKASLAALAERPWITVEWLTRYAPELNDIERSWRDLKRRRLAHQTSRDATNRNSTIHAAAKRLNKERIVPHPHGNQRNCLDHLLAAIVQHCGQWLSPVIRINGQESAVVTRVLTPRRQIAAAIVLLCGGLSLPAAAQSLTCPVPQVVQGPGVLKESPSQIAETGSFLVSGNSVNRAPEVVADLRKRYPGVADAEIENYLVTAYCPVAAELNGLSVTEQQARVDQFARQASVAVYGH